MKKMLKRGLSLVLTLVMVAGLLPVTAFAAVDSTGKPTDLNNTLVLSIYTPEGSFPGEPAMHGSEDYISFNSSFAKTTASGKFKDNAVGELKESVLNDLVQGASNGRNTVWGVFSADGLKEKYFESDASIIKRENEITMIKAVFKELRKTNLNAEDYEIIWYVIKLQHSPGNGWWSRATTEWHIDGIIKERTPDYITINYYGNGNTTGSAPDGVTNHEKGKAYTILDSDMTKKMNGVSVDFLGWSAQPDGSGVFYAPGTVITPEENVSLYAMWDTTTQYTATVNTYLDGELLDEDKIHGGERNLYLSTDEKHYYQLTHTGEGVYTAKITGNGKFHLYNQNADDTYTQVGDRQLTIYNQNGSMDVYHYSLTYNPNGGDFEADPGKQIYYYGDTVTATTEVPTKKGYRFLGWEDKDGKLIQPGQEVTASVTGTMVLTAQWEKTVNVTVNVTIDHNGGNGYDQMDSKNEASMALVGRENSTSPYLEVPGKTLSLSDTAHEGFDFGTVNNVTTYAGNTYTFTDLPGGTTEYTVVTSKSGYDTTVTPRQETDGNWIIDVKMIYNPSNFDLNFTVVVDDSVPDQYIPDAAIVKVTFWSTKNEKWEIITQQEGGLPGIRVDIDPDTRSGSGSYPVWKYESGGEIPYGNRIVVTSFVYPDGTIVPVNQVEGENEEWTDNVYTATVSDVTGGQKYGELYGAYYDKTSNSQKGTLNAVITMDLHNVTFDAQGGKVNGQDSQTVTEQYKIPSFKDYVPTRDGGYTFGGWCLDADCTKAATEGVDLTQNITLYAKWIEPLTISGTISIAGSYDQNGVDVPVNDIDRATEAVVVLQELRDGHIYEVDSQTVKFEYGEDNNAATDYSFTGIPNQGKIYQIHVLELNYGTAYDNESDTNSEYTANEYTAVFGGDNVADVDAHLTFVPPAYGQPMKVDATQIGEGFRPGSVLAEVMYRDTGDNHPFNRISQHNVEPYGVQIGLTNGIGTGTQSIWKWHTDGKLYDYQMNISKVDGNTFNSDTAPYYITYAAPTYWDANTNAPSGDLVATLIPKKYQISFDLNAGTDIVTGMEGYEQSYTNEAGDTVNGYGVIHTWSYDTPINAVPQRTGYTFLGWEANVDDAYVENKIGADVENKIVAEVHQEVILTAQWEKITFTVEAVSNPAEGGTTTVDGSAKTDEGTYEYGSTVTVTAAPAEGYTFKGWYENGARVSGDLSYSFNIFDNHNFTAMFSQTQYSVKVQAKPEDGGTVAVSNNGIFTYGEEATVTATVNTGYSFLGWYENDKLVSGDLSYSFKIFENHDFTAMFSLNKYNVTTKADPAEGGSVTKGGTYSHGTSVTVTATAKEGYTFTGWFENGAVASDKATYTFTAERDRTLTANFIRVYTIDATATTGGTVTGGGTYNEGQEAIVTATADNGYAFLGWYENDQLVSSELSYSFKVTADRTLTAQFSKVYAITTIAETGGSVSGGNVYQPMASATITAKANEGYYFVGWYDEKNELVTADSEYTLTVKENRTFTAKFEKAVSYKCDYVYIFGYNDTQIGATGPLLRGELSQMIYRLVKQQDRNTSNGGNSFEDTSGEWFESGISYMAKVGAIDRTKANAYPLASVTRGETYKMICLGLDFTDDTELNYSDYAAILRNSGHLEGDGNVTGKIMRWEFCSLFNAILGRSNYCMNGFIDTEGNEVTAETYRYTDLKPSDSYYRTMMIATSTFDGDRIDLVNRMERNRYDFTN